MSDQNLAIVMRARDRWNAGDLDGYLGMYDDAIVIHGYAGLEPGLANVRAFYEAFLAAFPNCQLDFQDIFAADDKAAIRFTLNGVHGGPFRGTPATGKRMSMPGITILRFANGKCVERWSQADSLGLLAQLGALPQ
jgi:steroid delta-isomerase-like uncharacterized protein